MKIKPSPTFHACNCFVLPSEPEPYVFIVYISLGFHVSNLGPGFHFKFQILNGHTKMFNPSVTIFYPWQLFGTLVYPQPVLICHCFLPRVVSPLVTFRLCFPC